MMCTYFCGSDDFNCALNDGKSYESNMPVEIDCIYNVIFRWDMMFFQKSVTDLTWYLKGLGIDGSSLVFPAEKCISQISLAEKYAVGINSQRLYVVYFNFDNSKRVLTWKIEEFPESSVKIIHLASNDRTIFGVDECSRIYEIDFESKLNLKWQLNEVKVKKIFCSYDHFIALSDTGALYTWGTGSRGQLGLRDCLLKCDIPTRIEFFDDLPSIVSDICCGGWHTLALTSDGDVYSWGWNECFQLGHSSDKIASYSSDPYPIDLGSGDDPIVSIAAGSRHSVCLLKSGKVYTFGLNKQGQLGTGDTENRREPEEIKFKHRPIGVSCGRYSTFIYATLQQNV